MVVISFDDFQSPVLKWQFCDDLIAIDVGYGLLHPIYKIEVERFSRTPNIRHDIC